MSKKLKNTFPAVSDGFFNMTQILPLVVSMSVCSAFSMNAALISAIICSFAYPFAGLLPSYSLFIILYSISAFYGLSTALAGTFLCAVLLFIISFFKTDNLKPAVYTPAVAAVMLGFTLYMTVMQTTDYFGIGATGKNVVEMIKSYRSLGFHGNWRGVLYGTIVLVVMIVYRRKFKNLSKKIPAAFWCLIITIPLNIFLIPERIISPIKEIGSYGYVPEFISIKSVNYFGMLICGAAMVFIFLYKITAKSISFDNKNILMTGVFLFAASITGCIAPGLTNKKEKNILFKIISAFTCSLTCSAIIILLNKYLGRTPVSTAAVILIIGMWQQNVWHYLKTALTSGLPGVAIFIYIILIILTVNPEAGIISASFICAGNKLIQKRNNITNKLITERL